MSRNMVGYERIDKKVKKLNKCFNIEVNTVFTNENERK